MSGLECERPRFERGTVVPWAVGVVARRRILPPSDTASTTIPFLRRCGYEGPIIVVSGEMTRSRRQELMVAGASDVIHKDDIDSVRISEALKTAFNMDAETAA